MMFFWFFFFYSFTFRLCSKCHINPDSNRNSNVAAGIQTVLEGGSDSGNHQWTVHGMRDSFGDTAEMSQPLTHSWLPSTLSVRLMAGLRLSDPPLETSRTEVWDNGVRGG